MKSGSAIRKTGRTVLIFGGAGFIGSNWAQHLLEETGARVHLFDNLSRPGARHNLEMLRRLRDASRLEITIADVRNTAAVAAAVSGATEVYHFAAQVAVTASLADPRFDFEVNAGGTLNILEAVRKSGHRPFFLYTSTNKVYGELNAGELARIQTHYCQGISESQPLDPHSPYGCSKGAADQYVHDYARIYGLPTVVFRMSCIAGQRQFGTEDQGWVAHFLYQALRGQPLTIFGDGCQVRDVLYVGDLLRALDAARLSQTETAGQIYNIGGGADNAVSLLEMIAEIERLTARTVRFTHERRTRPGDQRIYITDFSKFTRHTGWKPRTPVAETVRHIFEWWGQNRELFEAGAANVRDGEAAGLPMAELPEIA